MNRTFRPRSLARLALGTGLLAASAVFTVPAALHAQAVSNPTSVQGPEGVVVQNGDIFFYKVTAVRQDIDAVNYIHRSGTHIGFVGTNLLPEAKGEASVKSDRGGLTISAKFSGLRPANSFGPQFLTYVLWAISPDGRPQNLGEVLPAGTKNNIDVTTALQSFGLIVTAEPYFSVSTPSDLIVLKNVFTDRTEGTLETVTAHATLYPHGVYTEETAGQNTVSHPITRNERSPLELYEAYNAVRIAVQTGADKYSPEIISTAKQDLQNAAAIDESKHRDEKMEISDAREAVQKSEDARLDTLRKQAAERQRNAELAKDQAQEQAAASAAAAAASQQQAEAARQAQQQAQLQSAQAQLARAQADAEAAQARAAELAANQRADSAEATREKLRAQLNAVLQTVVTPRGLVVTLADVLFDTGKFTLKPETKVSLARVAGILQAYPSLKIQVEGYTDSTGSDALNQTLSENRASTTKDFLISQGVAADNVSSAGYGKSNPVGDNTTAAGRQQNRRVNLVVSGAAIGIEQSAPANQ